MVLAGQGSKVIHSFFGASIAPRSLVLRLDFRGRGGGRRMRSWNARNWSAIQLQVVDPLDRTGPRGPSS